MEDLVDFTNLDAIEMHLKHEADTPHCFANFLMR